MKKFIAGNNLNSAITISNNLIKKNIQPIVNYISEQNNSDNIDNISDKIQSFYSNEDNSFSISEEVIQEINKEYIDFVNRKMNFLELIKETNKKMLSQIDEIKFPSLSKLLTQKCGTILNNENKSIVCSICNKKGIVH